MDHERMVHGRKIGRLRMSKIKQTPGRLDIIATKGDKFSVLIDFDIDTTGYTWNAAVVHSSTTAFTVTSATDGSGQETISLASTDTNDIALGTWSWYMDRTDAGFQRRYLAGDFKLVQYYE